MAFTIEKMPFHGMAVCCFNGVLLCYRRGNLVCYETDTYKCIKVIPLPLNKFKKLLCQFRILERLLHIEARWGVAVGEKNALVCFENQILSVDIATGKVQREPVQPRGKPLQCFEIKDINGFEDGYLIGDYGRNEKREAVRIFQKKKSNNSWDVVFTFPSGTVRHIHGFAANATEKCVYILTGDEDLECGIWKATDGFESVIPILQGQQKYRACTMLPIKDGFYYLTDTPLERNYLVKTVGGKIQPVKEIPGTVIYGIHVGNTLFFSTTVEPDEHVKNKLDYWLSTKPGKGIQDHAAHVFMLDCEGKLMEIVRFEHDGWPLRLFQYATVRFAGGKGPCVYATVLCAKKADYTIVKICL